MSGASPAGHADLVTGLFDDAALFPPGNAPLDRAVPQHRDYRTAWYAHTVGPFLCPDATLSSLRGMLSPGEPLRLGLILPGGPAALGPAVAEVTGDPRLVLAAVEIAPSGEGDVLAGVRQVLDGLDAQLPPGVLGYVEVPRGPSMDAALDMLAGTPYRAKFRTGGLRAQAFPSERELGGFITACVSRDLPFKCTAGLHNAVRHTDPETGFEHHGFLNILLAVAAAIDGDDPAATLAERSGDALAVRAARLTDAQVAEVRRRFRSYGTCSVTEPLADLLALGLISKP